MEGGVGLIGHLPWNTSEIHGMLLSSWLFTIFSCMKGVFSPSHNSFSPLLEQKSYDNNSSCHEMQWNIKIESCSNLASTQKLPPPPPPQIINWQKKCLIQLSLLWNFMLVVHWSLVSLGCSLHVRPMLEGNHVMKAFVLIQACSS